MRNFSPDLIVEVTRACDRRCRGCYAPNLLVNRNTVNVAEKSELFLDKNTLQHALNTLATGEKVNSIAIRGGEPSLHPELPTIIKIVAHFATEVFIETHGRWLNQIEPHSLSEKILKECHKTGATLKISFDSMHGLSGEKLKNLVEIVNKHGVEWAVAITEDTKADALKIIEAAPWLSFERVIFQLKAKNSLDLLKPRLGTITAQGKFQNHLTSKFI